eukprot:TRINITY_DN176_c0_g2_i7.p1 TRINITY_DN176_c0_g2~~TRINITY_DN176_c0_g2_i7.p1  ORF type:complete len:233 (+),score=64.66 TRINITY_DN176_c0_g2_i7:67-699(+)
MAACLAGLGRPLTFGGGASGRDPAAPQRAALGRIDANQHPKQRKPQRSPPRPCGAAQQQQPAPRRGACGAVCAARRCVWSSGQGRGCEGVLVTDPASALCTLGTKRLVWVAQGTGPGKVASQCIIELRRATAHAQRDRPVLRVSVSADARGFPQSCVVAGSPHATHGFTDLLRWPLAAPTVQGSGVEERSCFVTAAEAGRFVRLAFSAAA